eukprot:6699932-Pyramimonas_sp.AAC.1
MERNAHEGVVEIQDKNLDDAPRDPRCALRQESQIDAAVYPPRQHYPLVCRRSEVDRIGF